MALTFPRAMPLRGVNAISFSLQRVDYASPTVGGGGASVTAGLPRWVAKWTLAETEPRLSDEWRAWVTSLRGAQRLFIGRDTSRPWPAYYRSGLPTGWNGALTAWSQTITADGQAILSVSGLYGGMGVGTGDYIDLRWGSDGQERRFLVRALEDCAWSGGSASFAIEPPIPALVPANAAAHMDQPGCVMRLVTSDTSVADVSLIGSIAGATVAGLQAVMA